MTAELGDSAKPRCTSTRGRGCSSRCTHVGDGDPSRGGKFIAYYQARPGGAARGPVMDYLNGGKWKLVAELTEVESGKRSDRPKLTEALKLCRLHGATLIIAKLDRPARNVAFILIKSGVEFHAVDFPQANRLTVHILAAVAEHEAKAISERTKAALAAAKRRGVKIGGYRGTTIPKAALEAASRALKKQSAGATSLRAIAAGLNRTTNSNSSRRGFVTNAGHARLGA